MGERQKHGFKFEENIINKYGMVGNTLYTSQWDAYYKEIPVSIKTKKLGGAIEMADFFRNAEVDEDFILVVGFWEGNKDNIVEEHTVYINKNYWKSQFNEELVEDFRGIFDGITNSYDDDVKWKKRMNSAKELWKNTKSDINVNFKRDHKKQKRVQCSIKNSMFYEVYTKYYSVELGK